MKKQPEYVDYLEILKRQAVKEALDRIETAARKATEQDTIEYYLQLDDVLAALDEERERLE